MNLQENIARKRFQCRGRNPTPSRRRKISGSSIHSSNLMEEYIAKTKQQLEIDEKRLIIEERNARSNEIMAASFKAMSQSLTILMQHVSHHIFLFICYYFIIHDIFYKKLFKIKLSLVNIPSRNATSSLYTFAL